MPAILFPRHPSPSPVPYSRPPVTSSPTRTSKIKGNPTKTHFHASGCPQERLTSSTRADGYIVHTSILMNDAHLNRLPPTRRNPEVGSRDPELRLAAAEYLSQRKVCLSQLEVEKATIKQLRASNEATEHKILHDLVEEGKDFTSLDVAAALKVAQAARNTLATAVDVLLREIDIYGLQIGIAEDELDDVTARLLDADLQIDRLKAIQRVPPEKCLRV